MIVFDLVCQAAGHRFEGWFGSTEAYEDQARRGMLCCPHCGSTEVAKAPMAPNLARKGNQAAPSTPSAQPVVGGTAPPAVQEVLTTLASLQAAALQKSRWVGAGFAEQSRAMHYGERDAEVIHGQATAEEARDLLDEGIAVMPLPFPVAPPDELN
jgi:hypothetical protein